MATAKCDWSCNCTGLCMKYPKESYYGFNPMGKTFKDRDKYNRKHDLEDTPHSKYDRELKRKLKEQLDDPKDDFNPFLGI